MSTNIYAISTYTFMTQVALDIDFIAFGAHIVGPVEVDEDQSEDRLAEPAAESRWLYFRVTLLSNLDTIDGALEGARYGRPRLLKLLSLLSFFTGHPFVPSESFQNSSRKHFGEIPEDLRALASSDFIITRFEIDEQDLSNDLRLFLHFGSQSTRSAILLFSLLERYRKAAFLGDEEDDLAVEESFLAYFHVLEALAQESKPDRDKLLEQKIIAFASDVVRKTFFLDGSAAAQAADEMSKMTGSLIKSSGKFGILSDILYSLASLRIHDPITSEFARRLVQIRNSIAHARLVAQDRVLTWPLPAFLSPLDESDLEIVSFLPFIVRRCIAALVGSKLGMDEWEEARSYLDPPAYLIHDFINNKRSQNLTPAEFESGAVAGVRPSTLVRYILKRRNSKTWVETLASVAGAYVQAVTATESNARELLLLSVLLADAAEEAIATSARRHVQSIHENEWGDYSNVKDVLRGLEVQSVQPQWFRRWIEEKGHYSKPSQKETKLSDSSGLSDDR